MAVPRHPAQLYESISSFLLFLFLYYLWNRRKSFTPRGLLFGLFVVILFSLRFVYEFLKENQVDKENDLLNTIGMNIGQLLSVPLILVGIFILFRAVTKPTYVNPIK
jgi:prolipoprotein diacylglyceryltransferase